MAVSLLEQPPTTAEIGGDEFMGKDPAVLFYTGDFLIGVADMPFLERGYYITLLCMQHQKGHLSAETICFSLGLRSVSEISKVLEKFNIDDDGKYFNTRMELETKKRSVYTESRRNNGIKGGRPPKDAPEQQNHMDKHMQNHIGIHMGNENENENRDRNGDEIDAREVKKNKRQTHGVYGWVKLSDDEYSRLLSDIGDAETKRCIEYIDESAQSTGNKNKWKDWNLVIRKCSKNKWGLSNSSVTVAKGDKSFSEVIRERMG